MLREAEQSRAGSLDVWVAVWVAEATPKQHHLDLLAPALSAEDLGDVTVSAAVSREVVVVVEGSVAKTEDLGEAAAAVSVVAVIVGSVSKTAMLLLTPQQDRDLMVGSGVVVTMAVTVVVTVTVTATESPVVGILHALAPAHLMIDQVDPHLDSTETEEQVRISSLSVIDANTATTIARETTTTGNVHSKAVTRIRASSAATRSRLIQTTPGCLGGYVLSSVFRNCCSDFSSFSLPFVNKGKQG